MVHTTPKDIKAEWSEGCKRVFTLQQQGNFLREKHGYDILAKHAMKKIAKYRLDNDGMSADMEPQPMRVVHIIKSLKNSEEYNLLKEVYRDIIFLIAVSCSADKRFNNFMHKYPAVNPDQLKRGYTLLSEKDQDEGMEHGQEVRKIFYQADLFLNSKDSNIRNEIERFLKLLFGIEIFSPTVDEVMMHAAYSASMRSLCLSRQVGAAIATESGELLSTGWNDVPTYNGGLATDYNDKSKENLCKNVKKCNSNPYLLNFLGKIIEGLQKDGIQVPDNFLEAREKKEDLLKRFGLNNILEYSRSVHAEMEAILAVARSGRAGIVGSILYVTTYPCDNCAKHIIASGIHKVVFIEPYPKSRAQHFFHSLISEHSESSDVINTVKFAQFIGVSPQAYSRLFRYSFKRKDDITGEACYEKNSSFPRTDAFLDGFTIYESRVIKDIEGGDDEKSK